MLKKEFEGRTNLSMTEDEFNGVNALYMACGDNIDKDVFCKLYLDFDGRLQLLHMIEREHQRMKEAQEEEMLLNKEAHEIISDAADAILEISDMSSCTVPVREELEKKAWWLVGGSEVIKRKAKMGISFNEEEIEYINKYLK